MNTTKVPNSLISFEFIGYHEMWTEAFDRWRIQLHESSIGYPDSSHDDKFQLQLSYDLGHIPVLSKGTLFYLGNAGMLEWKVMC